MVLLSTKNTHCCSWCDISQHLHSLFEFLSLSSAALSPLKLGTLAVRPLTICLHTVPTSSFPPVPFLHDPTDSFELLSFGKHFRFLGNSLRDFTVKPLTKNYIPHLPKMYIFETKTVTDIFFNWNVIDIEHYITFKCATWRFYIGIYCEMITINLVNFHHRI